MRRAVLLQSAATWPSYVVLPTLLALLSVGLAAQKTAQYFPPRGQWQKKSSAEVGMDPAKFQQAIEFAQSHENPWAFAKDQVRTFGSPLGPVPKQRASSNGVIVRHGYIVAEFGNTKANDPVYSAAKSFLSTVCGIAVAQGLIRDVNDPVAEYVHDGGYDSPHNSKITWKNHLQQESEWEGVMCGKNANFIGHDEFGNGEMKPRPIEEPGSHYEYNDVRINRFSLSLLRVFGKPLPEVLKQSIMDPIGASQEWRWMGTARWFPIGEPAEGDRRGGEFPEQFTCLRHERIYAVRRRHVHYAIDNDRDALRSRLAGAKGPRKLQSGHIVHSDLV